MDKYASTLKNGGIGVIATDTIYGIVGQALKHDTVQRIYTVKQRTPTKPFIILISNTKDLEKFDIILHQTIHDLLEKYWPGPVSIILDCTNPNLEYLHRGTNTLAFRMPANPELIELLKITGPLVAPSANPEGLEPATDVDVAFTYFGDSIDFYQAGAVKIKPSKIIKITDQGEKVIRP